MLGVGEEAGRRMAVVEEGDWNGVRSVCAMIDCGRCWEKSKPDGDGDSPLQSARPDFGNFAILRGRHVIVSRFPLLKLNLVVLNSPCLLSKKRALWKSRSFNTPTPDAARSLGVKPRGT